MKKLLVFTFAFAVLGLAACGSETTDATDDATMDEMTPTEEVMDDSTAADMMEDAEGMMDDATGAMDEATDAMGDAADAMEEAAGDAADAAHDAADAAGEVVDGQ